MDIPYRSISGCPPVYASASASGADIRAFLEKPLVLEPGDYALIPTGLFLEIPPGYEVQIRPRSGLALRRGITLLNSPGTIDADYRGEIKILLINHGKEPFSVRSGDRIAQMVAAQTIQVNFKKTESLNKTDRGQQGFGSTGL